jgi:hypothetical protein
MIVFPCKNCDYGLDSIINFFVKVLRDEGVSNDLNETELSGYCPRCEESFFFGGKMFAHLLATRVNEGHDEDNTAVGNFLELDEEESTIIDMLVGEERHDELEEFIRSLWENRLRPTLE